LPLLLVVLVLGFFQEFRERGECGHRRIFRPDLRLFVELK
jgi:hypothetical protein